MSGASGRALDEALMARAIAEARRGRPSPNPHVGAVIATPEGEIVSVGHHERAGEAHAEVAALRAADRTEGMTLYVTMEPCNHHGRTPPCTEAILAAGIRRVVIGAVDPAPHVPGSSARLRAAGVEVEAGVLAEECVALLADFTKHITKGLPFVTLKAAVTLDGRMAARTGDSKWITGEAARAEAHRLRDQSDAVLVGVGTVLADDPQLDVRHVEGIDPRRIALDTHLRTPPTARILGKGGATTLVHGPGADETKRARLRDAGATLLEVPTAADGRLDVGYALRELAARDVVRLLVEGGPRVHASLLAAGHVDRVAVFVAPRIVGDALAPALAEGASGAEGLASIANAWQLTRVVVERIGDDVLFRGDVTRPTDRAR
ncbi:MAG: bifunctional diaminohydroxyphosphoribosylaminopyrimidine deaminase/5-amino-6-(5-phosphoribosylamino)uracil reductase RibD [Myxococcales bacterium]|nr:bifunctional diaminohydroxyphosphoribosylaminopyrimidine deaminase/5-amino-6-(5-phosphoribosylamino)uracil reductase RibD [Myxococcales bacterium]